MNSTTDPHAVGQEWTKSLSAAQSRLIRHSFAVVARDQDQAGRIFQQRLIFLDPSLRFVIANDRDEPGRRLMELLGILIGNADAERFISPDIGEIACEWSKRTGSPGDFETVGTALLDMLAMTLGEGFTPEVAEAWAEFYGITARLLEGTGFAGAA